MLDKLAIVTQLKNWTTCDIADGLSRLKHRHGGFLECLTMYSPHFQSGPTKIAGPVFTVKFAPKNDAVAPKISGHYIDQIPKDAILFISQPLPHINSVFGGLMALRAHKLGVAGVVVDGRLRDLQEHRDLGFPVFAKGAGTTAGGEVCRPSELNVPVRFNSEIQEAWIRPGDYMIADLNGVVCLPGELAEAVLDVVPRINEADRKCAEGIAQGRTVEDVFREFRG
ncbi:Ribonuclease E inhibitor RraA/Dimethylmenaquinone methyltransferase [Elaphomyces granulatus]|jgi:regulator of RNase E activity RraA